MPASGYADVRPGKSAITAVRSAGVMRDQCAISSIDRQHPSHNRFLPIVQMLTHGLSIFCTGTMLMKSGNDTGVSQSVVSFALRKPGIGPFQPPSSGPSS